MNTRSRTYETLDIILVNIIQRCIYKVKKQGMLLEFDIFFVKCTSKLKPMHENRPAEFVYTRKCKRAAGIRQDEL